MGGEDPLEEGMATYSSVLTWRNPWTRGALAGCSPWGFKRVRHNLATKQQEQLFLSLQLYELHEGRDFVSILQHSITSAKGI